MVGCLFSFPLSEMFTQLCKRVKGRRGRDGGKNDSAVSRLLVPAVYVHRLFT